MAKDSFYEQLSREVSYALRHKPEKLSLDMDEEGYVSVDQLLAGLEKQARWMGVNRSDLEEMVARCDKQRFELSGDKIRACYGHSIPMKIKKTEQQPPFILYHGTGASSLASIQENGLQPYTRQYVHLSTDKETALNVGSRKGKPVLLTVYASHAYHSGVKFYLGNGTTWLSDPIPPQFIGRTDPST